MPIVKATDENIRIAAEILRGGGLAAFPTETVYGLGGDAFNAGALAKIFAAKNRPRFDPLIVHIAGVESLEKIADLSLLEPDARGWLEVLAGHFWPGPLTLVVPKWKHVSDLATSGLPTVAVRVPANETARRLIALSTRAVAAPSANPFGYLSPTNAEHVMETLGNNVDIILDGGPARVGVESTVLDLCGKRPRILRPGGVPQEEIEALIGPVDEGAAGGGGASEGAMASPGLLKSHYAPAVPLSAYEDVRLMPANHTTCVQAAGTQAAFLFFDGLSRDRWLSSLLPESGAATCVVLSETGNPADAASRLFEVLHQLDGSGVTHIHAQLAPEIGLGRAINDRLRRAANK